MNVCCIMVTKQSLCYDLDTAVSFNKGLLNRNITLDIEYNKNRQTFSRYLHKIVMKVKQKLSKKDYALKETYIYTKEILNVYVFWKQHLETESNES